MTANPSQAPQASDAPSQAATPEPGVPIAVVTPAGDGLRVRSRPEVSADSKKLTPLLAAGSRMLVVNGPVPADGYDWYEVRADNDLFGWVAAGKDGEDWIAPAAANCTDDLDESALVDRRPDRLLRLLRRHARERSSAQRCDVAMPGDRRRPDVPVHRR